jgi:hypothetical protein
MLAMSRLACVFMMCAVASHPALAGEGFAHGGARVSAPRVAHALRAFRAARGEAPRRVVAADTVPGRDAAHVRRPVAIVVWPYAPIDGIPSIETPAGDTGAEAPNVIVVERAPMAGAGPSGAEPLPDYGYVPGCRAIPNGYACDTRQQAAAP